jgi:hypothetical protein
MIKTPLIRVIRLVEKIQLLHLDGSQIGMLCINPFQTGNVHPKDATCRFRQMRIPFEGMDFEVLAYRQGLTYDMLGLGNQFAGLGNVHTTGPTFPVFRALECIRWLSAEVS